VPRKARLEFPDAIYHVLNRGNDNSGIFQRDSAKQSFEECLFEACEKNNWILHAYVIMGNYYHLALETPEGNLVSGMQWLQSKFANRFNKQRKGRGPLFQGRYKAILVESGSALGEVCHYIHLDPVREGVVPIDRLKTYRFGSSWFLERRPDRPARLNLASSLEAAGPLPDSPPGWKAYFRFLNWQINEGPLAKGRDAEAMNRGWVIGSGAFKKKLLQNHGIPARSRARSSEKIAEIRQRQWSQALAPLLAKVSAKDQRDSRKSAPWRVKIAAHLKAHTSVSNAWLASQLNMGSGIYVSKHVGLFNRVKSKA
jgi:REP-associated tyrosine transposase